MDHTLKFPIINMIRLLMSMSLSMMMDDDYDDVDDSDDDNGDDDDRGVSTR